MTKTIEEHDRHKSHKHSLPFEIWAHRQYFAYIMDELLQSNGKFRNICEVRINWVTRHPQKTFSRFQKQSNIPPVFKIGFREVFFPFARALKHFKALDCIGMTMLGILWHRISFPYLSLFRFFSPYFLPSLLP